MTHVTCRLTAKNRDQLRNPTLGNRVRVTFTFTFFTVQDLSQLGKLWDAGDATGSWLWNMTPWTRSESQRCTSLSSTLLFNALSRRLTSVTLDHNQVPPPYCCDVNCAKCARKTSSILLFSWTRVCNRIACIVLMLEILPSVSRNCYVSAVSTTKCNMWLHIKIMTTSSFTGCALLVCTNFLRQFKIHMIHFFSLLESVFYECSCVPRVSTSVAWRHI